MEQKRYLNRKEQKKIFETTVRNFPDECQTPNYRPRKPTEHQPGKNAKKLHADASFSNYRIRKIKKKLLRAARGKTITYRASKVKLFRNQASKGSEVFSVERKTHQSRCLHPVKLSLKSEEERTQISDIRIGRGDGTTDLMHIKRIINDCYEQPLCPHYG